MYTQKAKTGKKFALFYWRQADRYKIGNTGPKNTNLQPVIILDMRKKSPKKPVIFMVIEMDLILQITQQEISIVSWI